MLAINQYRRNTRARRLRVSVGARASTRTPVVSRESMRCYRPVNRVRTRALHNRRRVLRQFVFTEPGTFNRGTGAAAEQQFPLLLRSADERRNFREYVRGFSINHGALHLLRGASHKHLLTLRAQGARIAGAVRRQRKTSH